MFCTLVENRIFGDMKRCLTVTKQMHGGMMKMMKHSEGSKESFEPYQLTCGSSHRSIFGLGRGARERGLFLGFPRDGWAS